MQVARKKVLIYQSGKDIYTHLPTFFNNNDVTHFIWKEHMPSWGAQISNNTHSVSLLHKLLICFESSSTILLYHLLLEQNICYIPFESDGILKLDPTEEAFYSVFESHLFTSPL